MGHVDGDDDGVGYGVEGRSNTYAGVIGRTDSGGVYGVSNYGDGVHGTSVTLSGVYGGSDTGDGVYGESGSGYGVYGGSYTGDGVYGESNNAFGVWGHSNLQVGVRGDSNSNVGVSGYRLNCRYGRRKRERVDKVYLILTLERPLT